MEVQYQIYLGRIHVEFLGIYLSEAHKRLRVVRNGAFRLDTNSSVAKQGQHGMASKADVGVGGSFLVKPYYIYLDGSKTAKNQLSLLGPLHGTLSLGCNNLKRRSCIMLISVACARKRGNTLILCSLITLCTMQREQEFWCIP